MARPAKRIRIMNPEEAPMEIESPLSNIDSNDSPGTPIRTLNLSDLQRRAVMIDGELQPRDALPESNSGVDLSPRAPVILITGSAPAAAGGIAIGGIGTSSTVPPSISIGGSTTGSVTAPTLATTTTSKFAISIGTGSQVSLVTSGSVPTVSTAINVGPVPTVTIPRTSSSLEPPTTKPTTNSASPSPSPTTEPSSTLTPTQSKPSKTSKTSKTADKPSPTDTPTATSGEPSTLTTSTSSPNSSSDETDLPATTTGLPDGNIVTITAASTWEVSYYNGSLVTVAIPATTFSAVLSTDTDGNVYTMTAGPAYGINAGDYSSSASSLGDAGIAAATPAPGSGTASTTATATSTSSSGTGSSTSGSGGGDSPSSPLTPVQQQVVGGVVGGVAGIAVALLILLVVLRWYRRRIRDRADLPEQYITRNLSGDGPEFISQRTSDTPLLTTVVSNLRKFRPLSSLTTGSRSTDFTASTVPESERGFQRIAGRRIESVLSTGGDGYGGNYGAFEKDSVAYAQPFGRESNYGALEKIGVARTQPLRAESVYSTFEKDNVANAQPRRTDSVLEGTSFYKDDTGFYGGRGSSSPIPTSPIPASPVGSGSSLKYSTIPDFPEVPSRPASKAIMRSSPARTPVTLSPVPSEITLPAHTQPALTDDAPPLPNVVGLAIPMPRDSIGRSLASRDGSAISGRSRSTVRSSVRSSRFAEDIA